MQKHTLVQDKIKKYCTGLRWCNKKQRWRTSTKPLGPCYKSIESKPVERLAEIEKTFEVLQKINLTKTTSKAHLGSLVTTNNGLFFLSVSLGVVTYQNTAYYCIGLQTPIGKLLTGKHVGDSFCFRETTYQINSIV